MTTPTEYQGKQFGELLERTMAILRWARCTFGCRDNYGVTFSVLDDGARQWVCKNCGYAQDFR